MKLPTIKKKISAFLLKDDGKISKQSLLTIGAFLSSAVISSIISSEDVLAKRCTIVDDPAQSYVHSNGINPVHNGKIHYVEHSHHGSHCSHGSHGSY